MRAQTEARGGAWDAAAAQRLEAFLRGRRSPLAASVSARYLERLQTLAKASGGSDGGGGGGCGSGSGIGGGGGSEGDGGNGDGRNGDNESLQSLSGFSAASGLLGHLQQPTPPRGRARGAGGGVGGGVGPGPGAPSGGGGGDGALMRKRSKSGPHPLQLHWPRTGPSYCPSPDPGPSCCPPPDSGGPAHGSASGAPATAAASAAGAPASAVEALDREAMVAELARIRTVLRRVLSAMDRDATTAAARGAPGGSGGGEGTRPPHEFGPRGTLLFQLEAQAAALGLPSFQHPRRHAGSGGGGGGDDDDDEDDSGGGDEGGGGAALRRELRAKTGALDQCVRVVELCEARQAEATREAARLARENARLRSALLARNDEVRALRGWGGEETY